MCIQLRLPLDAHPGVVELHADLGATQLQPDLLLRTFDIVRHSIKDYQHPVLRKRIHCGSRFLPDR